MKNIAPHTLDSGFHTTQWSVIERCLQTEPASAREGLAILCRLYWQPVFVFLRQHGHSLHDAQDHTQDFFLHILQKPFLLQADRDRGRFRSFLLISLQNFLHDQHDRRSAIKRGGKVTFIPIESFSTEFPEVIADLPNLEPDSAFDLAWAETVILRATAAVQSSWIAKDRHRVFLALQPCLTDGDNTSKYQELAEKLGTTVANIKIEIHRMRLKMREAIRQQVASTVSSPEAIDAEIRHLLKMLALRGQGA